MNKKKKYREAKKQYRMTDEQKQKQRDYQRENIEKT